MTGGTERDRRRIDRRLSRYDLVLGIIPVAFLFALSGVALLQITPRAALFAASLVGALAVVDALFLNPPRGNAGGRGT